MQLTPVLINFVYKTDVSRSHGSHVYTLNTDVLAGVLLLGDVALTTRRKRSDVK